MEEKVFKSEQKVTSNANGFALQQESVFLNNLVGRSVFCEGSYGRVQFRRDL